MKNPFVRFERISSDLVTPESLLDFARYRPIAIINRKPANGNPGIYTRLMIRKDAMSGLEIVSMRWIEVLPSAVYTSYGGRNYDVGARHRNEIWISSDSENALRDVLSGSIGGWYGVEGDIPEMRKFLYSRRRKRGDRMDIVPYNEGEDVIWEPSCAHYDPNKKCEACR